MYDIWYHVSSSIRVKSEESLALAPKPLAIKLRTAMLTSQYSHSGTRRSDVLAPVIF
jgi:hypothetical protein